MSVHSVSIASMFGWVVDAFKLLRKSFLHLLSASVVTLLLVILMFVPMGIGMAVVMASGISGGMANGGMAMAGNMTLFYTLYFVTIVLSLLLFPPLLVGWFRLCQNIDHGNAVSGLDILKPYKDKSLWFRSIGFALLAFVIYLLTFGLFAIVFGSVFTDFMQQAAAQQAAAMSGATPAAPSFPIGFILGYFSFLAVAMFLQFVYLVGFTEISLRQTPVFEAMKRAALGVFKNIPQLIVFMICLFIAAFMALMLIGIIFVVLIAALSFVHEVLGLFVGGIAYLAILMCIYPLMFAGHYFVWKSILGAEQELISAPYDSTLSA